MSIYGHRRTMVKKNPDEKNQAEISGPEQPRLLQQPSKSVVLDKVKMKTVKISHINSDTDR
jgi:hypothetical protein